jgi:hypothetical protein
MLPLGAHGGYRLAGALGVYVVVSSIASVRFTLLLSRVVALFGRVGVHGFASAARAAPAQLTSQISISRLS